MMMIRINLLPTRQVKKRADGRQTLLLAAAVVVAAVGANAAWYLNREGVREEHAAKVAATHRQIAELEKVIGEVNNINKRRLDVEAKLKVLDELRKGRSGPVKMLDALATATPKKVWLRSLVEKDSSMKLSGTAISHDDVAELMRGLQTVVWTPKGMGRLVEQRKEAQTSRVELLGSNGAVEDFPVSQIGAFFTNVDLKKATQKDLTDSSKNKLKAVDFEIQLTASYSI